MEKSNYQNQPVQDEQHVMSRNGYEERSFCGISNACTPTTYNPYVWNANQPVTYDYNYMPIQQAAGSYYPCEPVQRGNVQGGLERANCNGSPGGFLPKNAENSLQPKISKNKKKVGTNLQKNKQVQETAAEQTAAQELKAKGKKKKKHLGISRRKRKKLREAAEAALAVSTSASEVNSITEENPSNVGGNDTCDQPEVMEETQEPMEEDLADTNGESNPEEMLPDESNSDMVNAKKLKEKKDKIAIISNQYPDVELKRQELQDIQAYVTETLMRLPQGSFFPRFQHTFLKKGAVVMICADKESKEWIQETIPKAEICPGMEFRTVDVSYLWKYTRAVVFVPGPRMDTTAILNILQKQNENLRTDKWLVYDRRNESKRGCELVVGLDGMSLETLGKIDFRPYFGLGRVRFVLQVEKVSEDQMHHSHYVLASV